VHQCLRSDHAVEELAARMPSVGDDAAVCVGCRVVEGQRRDCREHRIEPRTTDGSVRGFTVDTALELHALPEGTPFAPREFLVEDSTQKPPRCVRRVPSPAPCRACRLRTSSPRPTL